jgi:hypothetical protein
MGEAFGWGAIGASALRIGALIAYQFSPSRQVIAAVMALSPGLLTGPLVVTGFAVSLALSAI